MLVRVLAEHGLDLLLDRRLHALQAAHVRDATTLSRQILVAAAVRRTKLASKSLTLRGALQ